MYVNQKSGDYVHVLHFFLTPKFSGMATQSTGLETVIVGYNENKHKYQEDWLFCHYFDIFGINILIYSIMNYK